ncbi:hypothetical protein GUITHDRAFT_151256 [Guillardia theta CCMP2712]|uniref:Uncharacterized protein n=1 Tax=Guillardia theta (strain CCMP2712) TaxID=905079 RepID=L1JNS2_GUITC|nr:hypothetical protein GUITHDRAFT_151256 [Guillardia theta CCMP2712]EKX50231.1 hypothetical protein GUITHDRAFT_151256 [Guillardia theta CCMP2712]|eukprot:XP_005837211.1 hypothetical protein GUITHDRAFT_151256 [Guillardia theta CCMP2712]
MRAQILSSLCLVALCQPTFALTQISVQASRPNTKSVGAWGSDSDSHSWMASNEACFAAPRALLLHSAPRLCSRRCATSFRSPASSRRPLNMQQQTDAKEENAGNRALSFEETLKEIKEPCKKAWEGSATDVYDTFERLKSQGVLKKWNSMPVKSRAVSQNELKRMLKTELDLDTVLGISGGVQTEDLKKLTVGAFASSAIIGVLGTAIGGETGGFVYWLTFLGASIPLVLVGVGSVAPSLIGGVISGLQWQFDKTNTMERRIRHEAAHILAGYMCGLPIEGYEVEPMPMCKFYDRREGNIDDVEAWKKARPFNEEEVDKLAVVCLSGVMGELSLYERAAGGQQDLEQLQEVYFRAESEKLRNNRVREETTRWGAMKARTLLEENNDSFMRLCKQLEKGASIEECIASIEAA